MALRPGPSVVPHTATRSVAAEHHGFDVVRTARVLRTPFAASAVPRSERSPTSPEKVSSMKKVNVKAKGSVPGLAPGHDGSRKGNGNGIAIGLSPKQREAVNRTLNVALANAYVLLTKTKKAHWDVVGPQFMTLHKLWDEQYTAIANLADEAAERIRMLGGFPIGTLQGFLAATELTEDPGNVPTATDGVSMLLHDHEQRSSAPSAMPQSSVRENGATPEPPTLPPG